ncbi:hypothetical protein HPULCUR_009233 [Helicostylum pulchrum]|uniref:Protein YTP1-like C-terminal domain-containing protein n=1 Tax=Helicostylum pulchrum TaxID=562976 RepID=A0ABP9Y9W7_9FUNG
METIYSFSTHVPFKQPVVITHYISMAIAFLGCYPLLLTRQIRRQKVYIASASLFFASIGFISGYFIQLLETNTASIVLHIFAFLLLFFVTVQSILVTHRSKYISENFTTLHSLLPTRLLSKIPKWVDLALGWVILIIAFSYLTLAALVFTESCNQQQSQCLMPVAMGTGFIIYGTVSLLHLLAIIKLPRPSTPEYYEGVILTFWGFISLILASTPILGSEWRAINLGLLWFTGGVFSISLSVQTWIPALRERNIINSLIICFTGRAIISGITQVDDTYAAQVHTMLGYILMIGAVARLTQIIFRKSPADNLPLRMFQHETTQEEEDDEEETEISTKDTPKCRHKLLFATITLITGLLTCLLSICGGILFLGANVGWIRYMKFYIQDPSTYINITLAIAFLWSAYVFGLCTIYKNIKANNAIHQYEYLELDSTTDLPHHFEPEITTRDWPPSAIMMPMSPPPQQHQQQHDYIISTSPTNLSPTHHLPPLPPLQQQQQQPPFSPPKDTEKTIRPSEYRAKRRSLLIQSPVSYNRGRSSSNFNVGGVLPDEIMQLQKVTTPPPTDSNFRRSWLSSGSNNSSVGYYSGSIDSSAPNSPSFDQKMYSSISSTLPQQQQAEYSSTEVMRRNSLNEGVGEYYNQRRSVRKTESGKRKERRLMKSIL